MFLLETPAQAGRKSSLIHFLKAGGLAGALILLLSSCSSMGPKTIPADGFNYNAHIALQKNEQILLNIVRLRYGEVPLFLNVNSVINQYSRNVNGGLGGANLFGTPAVGANVDGGWADRPTITYTPMSGRMFSQNLLTPLPPAALFFLIQSGWSANLIMQLSTTSINGLFNEMTNPLDRRPADPGYLQVIDQLRTLQNAGVLGMDIGGTPTDPTIDVYFPERTLNDTVQASLDQFKRLLNLEPDSNRFSIRYGLIQETADELVMQTHSMLEILYGLGWYVEAPAEHIADGRTAATFRSDQTPLIRILSSKNRPDTAFVAINTRDYWYYIDDRDWESKKTFAIIQILLSLAEDGSQAVGPLISIGN